MADIKLAYASPQTVTITLASLPTDTNRLAGRESDAIDNSSAGMLDFLAQGNITTGTTPTANTFIEVWVVGSYDGSTWPNVFDGTDSAESITNGELKNACCKLVASWNNTVTTSNLTYSFGPTSIAALFGGVLPKKFAFFVTHNTGVNLNATAGNHFIAVEGVYQTVA
jgi:hypothetical protein